MISSGLSTADPICDQWERKNRMKLSTRGRYALRMMMEIYRQGDKKKPVSLSLVAKNTQLSRRYLEQLVIDMKRSSLIKGFSGKLGGYLLTRPGEDIKVVEIVEAAIGPINVVNCVLEPKSCSEADNCECRELYSIINNKITSIMSEVSLADLANGKAKNLLDS